MISTVFISSLPRFLQEPTFGYLPHPHPKRPRYDSTLMTVWRKKGRVYVARSVLPDLILTPLVCA